MPYPLFPLVNLSCLLRALKWVPHLCPSPPVQVQPKVPSHPPVLFFCCLPPPPSKGDPSFPGALPGPSRYSLHLSHSSKQQPESSFQNAIWWDNSLKNLLNPALLDLDPPCQAFHPTLNLKASGPFWRCLILFPPTTFVPGDFTHFLKVTCSTLLLYLILLLHSHCCSWLKVLMT